MDGSGSIKATNFLEVKRLVTDIASMFQISPEGIRMGGVQFGSVGQLLTIPMNTSATATTALFNTQVNNWKYLAGGTVSKVNDDELDRTIQAGNAPPVWAVGHVHAPDSEPLRPRRQPGVAAIAPISTAFA